MHEVETGRQLFGGDVVGQDVERRIATRCCLEEVRLKIRGDDDTARTDTLLQPEGYRSTAGTYFQTARSRTHSQAVEVCAGARIKDTKRSRRGLGG